MLTREDVESFLVRAEQDFEEVEQGMWVVPVGEDGANFVIHYSPPLLLLRVKVLDIATGDPRGGELYRRLLELNATDLIHGSYGIEEDDVILSDALELENLDFNEFQAAVDSMQVALASHMETLAPFRTAQAREEG